MLHGTRCKESPLQELFASGDGAPELGTVSVLSLSAHQGTEPRGSTAVRPGVKCQAVICGATGGAMFAFSECGSTVSDKVITYSSVS